MSCISTIRLRCSASFSKTFIISVVKGQIFMYSLYISHPSRSSSMQISFRGVIVSRELRQSDSPSQRLPNGLVEVPKFGPIKVTAVKDLQLGFTLLSNAIILLRIQDLRSPNTISVYLDLRRTSYIYGMLPGK